MINNKATNVSSGELGFVKYRAWTPCKTDQEAGKFLGHDLCGAWGQGRRKGLCSAKRRNRRNRALTRNIGLGAFDGALVGRCVLGDNLPGAVIAKAYFVELKLTEVVGEQVMVQAWAIECSFRLLESVR